MRQKHECSEKEAAEAAEKAKARLAEKMGKQPPPAPEPEAEPEPEPPPPLPEKSHVDDWQNYYREHEKRQLQAGRAQRCPRGCTRTLPTRCHAQAACVRAARSTANQT